MRLSQPGEPLDGGDELAPGVFGYAIEVDGAIYIPLVESVEKGEGNVGRFLDGLDKSKVWKFPNVISSKLAGMLQRRGFKPVREWAEDMGEHVIVWVSPKEAKQDDNTD